MDSPKNIIFSLCTTSLAVPLDMAASPPPEASRTRLVYLPCVNIRQTCSYAPPLHFPVIRSSPCVRSTSCRPRPTIFRAGRTRRTRRQRRLDRSQSSSRYFFLSSARLERLKSHEIVPFDPCAHHLLTIWLLRDPSIWFAGK